MQLKYKHIISIAALGFLGNVIAGFLKILHWEFPFFGMVLNGNVMRLLSVILFVVAALLLIIKVFSKKEKPRFE